MHPEKASMVQRQLMQGVLSAAALACCMVVAILTGSIEEQQGRVELGWRSADLAGKLGVPNRGLWGAKAAQQSVTDNMGANNLEISDTIRSIRATQDQPNFAAALHKLEKATESASAKAAELTQPSDWLDTATPQLPDPQGFVHRMQRMRLSSRYCRVHPESCKSLAPSFPGLDGMRYASDEFYKNPAEKSTAAELDPLEKDTAAELLQEGIAAGDSAAKSPGMPMQTKQKARTQSLYLEGASGNQLDGMPWLGPYFGQHGLQNPDDNVKWGAQAEKNAKPVEQLADPLWCGGPTCAEHSYARHQHSVANVLGGIVHNQAALRLGGERNAAEICAQTKLCGDAGGNKGSYGYLNNADGTPGTVPAVIWSKQVGLARTEELAELTKKSSSRHHYKFPSLKLGGRSFSGKGDTLLPHGQLWGLRGKHANTVRYHEYDGFYEGSQPDRAVVETPQQAGADAYVLEEKELSDGLSRIRAHNAKLAAALSSHVHEGKRAAHRTAGRSREGAGGMAKVVGDSKDFEKGAALFGVASSSVGTPRLDALAYRGRVEGRGSGGSAWLPKMRGLDMSVVSHESPTIALAEEEQEEEADQQQLSQISKSLP